MSKRIIESLDEEEKITEFAQKNERKKERKSYANCFHATHSGMRCLNTQRYGFKIGRECYNFCKEHFESTLFKLFTILTGKIEVPQEQINGIQNIIFDEGQGFDCLTLDETKRLATVFVNEPNTISGSIGGVRFGTLTISEFFNLFLQLIKDEKGFIIQFAAGPNTHLDTGSFQNKAFGYFNGDRVQIPTSSIYLNDDYGLPVISIEIEIRFIE